MWDVVVIGLGGVGSFALRAATAINKGTNGATASNTSKKILPKILGIEKFTPCHPFGSSHGHSRIYRHAYFEHEKYVPLLKESTKEFKKLQRDRNVQLLEECGMLVMEDEIHNDESFVANCFKSAKKHDINVELLSSNQLIKMYPQFKNLDTMHGILEPKAGFVRPELAIQAALDESRENGATIWDNTGVDEIREVDDRDNRSDDTNRSFVEISLSNGRGVIQSQKVIIAAGAWTSKLIPSWSNILKVTRQIQGWVETSTLEEISTSQKKGSIYNPNQMPAWFASTKKLEIPFYGIPNDPNNTAYPSHIKVALHGRNIEINPELKNPTVTNEELEELEYAFKLFFKNQNTQIDYNMSTTKNIVDAKACMYTMTPDGHFLVGKPRGYSNIYAAAGLSGHGFKMVPSLGKALVDMASKGKTVLDIDFLSPSRFGL